MKDFSAQFRGARGKRVAPGLSHLHAASFVRLTNAGLARSRLRAALRLVFVRMTGTTLDALDYVPRAVLDYRVDRVPSGQNVTVSPMR
jgi:hypothetical protein